MKHIPNILSVFRIILIPFFVIRVIAGDTLSAALILMLSGLTDLLVGFLARRFNWVSQLGKVLDPVADKLTQVTVCVVFFFKFSEYWFIFLILMVKDIAMLAFGGYLLKKGVRLEGAKWFGKVSTTLFYVTMVSVSLIPSMHVWMRYTLLIATAVCAMTAAALYIPDFRGYRKTGQAPKR